MKRAQIGGIGAVLLVVVAVVLVTFNVRKGTDSETKEQSSATQATKPAQPTVTTESQLVYLIEEEKIAHDVYTVMYQKYGAKVFGNILESESTHQGRVLTLLQARNIADPRATEVGKFNNQELQTLYDTLIAQGNISANEAYKVGVAIEEKDIADISKQLATATDDDVISTLDALRQGSENHLRAFNRQIN
jgi:hypothetical protein